MPTSKIFVRSGSDAAHSVDFNAAIAGLLNAPSWQVAIAADLVTFTLPTNNATLQMQGGPGPLQPTDFAVTGYTFADGDGFQLFDLDWGGLQFVLRNQTEAAFTAVLHSQMTDILAGSVLNLQYRGGVGMDMVTGTDNKDTIGGGGGDDALAGGAGGDLVLGGGGRDSLTGGDGRDRLDGQGGQDRLSGGQGADVFYFTGGDAARASGDTITDFRMADGDQISLSNIDAKTGGARLDSFTFITTGFHGTKGELRLEVGARDTVVQGDVDGDGAADFEIHLLHATDLDASAFAL